MKFKIENIEEFNFSEVDPNEDEFEFQGEIYTFSDSVCHNCWDGGTVLQSDNKYYCVRCQNFLQWYELEIKFINEELEEKEEFLLPVSWDDDKLNQWKEEFIEKRNLELQFRDYLLKNPEGGETYGIE